MLAVTTNAFSGGSNKNPLADWPEPHVIFVLLEMRIASKAIMDRNPAAIVIEHLQPPKGAFALLEDLPKWLGHHLLDPARPLVFLDRPFEAEELAEEMREGRAHPRGGRGELDAAGRIRLLRLGGMIATSPLLPPFLRFLAKRDVNEATALDLLHTAFPDMGA